MKVLNLQCAGMHTFEGWFGSEEDYQSQRERNLVACPMCANTEVRKLPSAPARSKLCGRWWQPAQGWRSCPALSTGPGPLKARGSNSAA